MSDTTFAVSPGVTPTGPRDPVDHAGKLRTALRRPIEALWRPRSPLVACDDTHALLAALRIAFYDHVPLRLSPDAVWVTLARGFALQVNANAERLRHRFVRHKGKEKLVVARPDFLPGRDNPWPEVFAAFGGPLADRTGGLTALVEADFSTTGPVERAVSHLMAMDAFRSYFEYVLLAGCGIPTVTLTGTAEDWRRVREKARRFADYGLEHWVEALDPVLAEFERAKAGRADAKFWRSMFRYHSGSGPAVLTGWANVLFPYLQDGHGNLSPNPYLADWQGRLAIDDRQHWRQRWDDPQGTGLGTFQACLTAVPLKVVWGDRETDMRLVGGLMGVSQEAGTLTVEPECGWVVAYEEPVDPLSPQYQWREERERMRDREELTCSL